MGVMISHDYSESEHVKVFEDIKNQWHAEWMSQSSVAITIGNMTMSVVPSKVNAVGTKVAFV